MTVSGMSFRCLMHFKVIYGFIWKCASLLKLCTILLNKLILILSRNKLQPQRVKGQCGVYMDPRTAYQHWHELQYSQFMSVHGLLNAMCDYQRMAQQKLTDDMLESILWKISSRTPARKLLMAPYKNSYRSCWQQNLRVSRKKAEKPNEWGIWKNVS